MFCGQQFGREPQVLSRAWRIAADAEVIDQISSKPLIRRALPFDKDQPAIQAYADRRCEAPDQQVVPLPSPGFDQERIGSEHEPGRMKDREGPTIGCRPQCRLPGSEEVRIDGLGKTPPPVPDRGDRQHDGTA